MPTTIDSAGITFNDTTSLTSANIGTAQLVNGSVTAAKLGTTEQKRIAKAWVNFDGTLATPITPRASYNVSSVTKNAVGDYTINFSTAMTDANYSGFISSSATTLSAPLQSIISTSTTQFRVGTQGRPTGNGEDCPIVSVTVFGN